MDAEKSTNKSKNSKRQLHLDALLDEQEVENQPPNKKQVENKDKTDTDEFENSSETRRRLKATKTGTNGANSSEGEGKGNQGELRDERTEPGINVGEKERRKDSDDELSRKRSREGSDSSVEEERTLCSGKQRERVGDHSERRKHSVEESTSLENFEGEMKDEEEKSTEEDSSFFQETTPIVNEGSPKRKRSLWDMMYGPPSCRERKPMSPPLFEFDDDSDSDNEYELPAAKNFSDQLLEELNNGKISDEANGDISLPEELAMLHYFICRPNEIRNATGTRVFRKMKYYNWKIFAEIPAEKLAEHFRHYVRPYVFSHFGLPQNVVREFKRIERKVLEIKQQERTVRNKFLKPLSFPIRKT